MTPLLVLHSLGKVGTQTEFAGWMEEGKECGREEARGRRGACHGGKPREEREERPPRLERSPGAVHPESKVQEGVTGAWRGTGSGPERFPR